MLYTQYTECAFDDAVGAEGGAGKKEYEAALNEAKKAIGVLQERKKNNDWPVLSCGERTEDIAQIEGTAKHIRDKFKTMVVLGMGASSRGGMTFNALVDNRFKAVSPTKIHFVENIDPHTFDQLLSSIDFKTTVFLVISKSGGTVETMAQTFVLIKEVESRIGKNAVKDHFIIITEPTPNPLRQLAEKHGIRTLPHDTKIGGRYAGLTVVGLLPAAVAGLDIRKVRKGAQVVVNDTFTGKLPQAAVGAALHDALLKKGKVVSVMMPYCDRLDAFSAWHQQLWEESLGKKGHGTTLLRALGAVDQHSQLQLFLNGPNDKFTTLIFLKQLGEGAEIEAAPENKLAYLGGHNVGDLMSAFQHATAKTLVRNNRPVRIFALEKLDEESLGALMMHFMIETMLTAELWKIDAFDQPAVEESKQIAREYLSSGAEQSEEIRIRA